MKFSRLLHIDIETYSPEPIGECGNYRYAMHPDFAILLFAYAYRDEPVRVIDLTSEQLPESIIADIMSPDCMKVAHNAIFERVCLTMHLRRLGLLKADEWLDPRQWYCTMVQSVRCGYPQSLAQVGEALGLEQQKMKEGKDLIKLFCTPHVTGALYANERVMPEDCPEEWKTFKSYCIRDVEVEQQIYNALSWHEVTDDEWELYAADQHINDRGVLVDVELAAQAARMDSSVKARLNKEAIDITGLSNPNSVTQLKEWIGERLGTQLETLRKSDISEMAGKTGDADVDRVLQIRAEMGKSSCAKYDTMLRVAGPDGRARGLTQFYGSRTGRWAGRLIQMQNLPQNHIAQLDFARRCLKEGDYDSLELCFGNVPDVMSQLIRTAFIPAKGEVFAVCDFSAIEARVLAWLAGEEWVLDTFRNGGDIYCATASQMFHVPVEKHGQNAGLRQKGKIAVLALGYGGGVGALDAMGGQRLGMTEAEEKDVVAKWREANTNIVNFWYRVEEAARCAALYGRTAMVGCLCFSKHYNTLCIELPSRRMICYPDMQETTNRFGRSSLKFHGMNQTTKKWEWVETHGGKLVENITQAVARDCLGHVISTIERDGSVGIVFHVHDEIVCECDSEEGLKYIQEVFANGPAWAKGLPLKGAGYTGNYYFKD